MQPMSFSLWSTFGKVYGGKNARKLKLTILNILFNVTLKIIYRYVNNPHEQDIEYVHNLEKLFFFFA